MSHPPAPESTAVGCPTGQTSEIWKSLRCNVKELARKCHTLKPVHKGPFEDFRGSICLMLSFILTPISDFSWLSVTDKYHDSPVVEKPKKKGRELQPWLSFNHGSLLSHLSEPGDERPHRLSSRLSSTTSPPRHLILYISTR